jgi:hypothetical protein
MGCRAASQASGARQVHVTDRRRDSSTRTVLVLVLAAAASTPAPDTTSARPTLLTKQLTLKVNRFRRDRQKGFTKHTRQELLDNKECRRVDVGTTLWAVAVFCMKAG